MAQMVGQGSRKLGRGSGQQAARRSMLVSAHFFLAVSAKGLCSLVLKCQLVTTEIPPPTLGVGTLGWPVGTSGCTVLIVIWGRKIQPTVGGAIPCVFGVW